MTHDEFQCDVPPGTGSQLVQVTTAGQSSSESIFFVYCSAVPGLGAVGLGLLLLLMVWALTVRRQRVA